MKSINRTPLNTLLLALLPAPVFARAQFQDWYAEYGFIFSRIIKEDCSSQYDYYKAGRVNNTYWLDTVRWLGSGHEVIEDLAVPLVNCMLNTCPEFIKSDMASANVLLGLAPSILAVLGSNVDETSLLAVVGKRPFLAITLAAGSPAVIPMRPLEYRDPLEALKVRRDELPPKLYSYHLEALISIIEYVLVLAAIANVAELSLELGFNTTLSFAPGYPYFIIAWSFFGPVAHSWAALGLNLRTRREDDIGSDKPWWGFLSQIWEIAGLTSQKHVASTVDLSSELKRFFIGYSQENPPPKFTVKQLNIYTWIWDFILAVMTSCHVILGTLVFSSMLFISARDGIYVLGRFACSVLVCRVVLMYELAKLRVLYNRPPAALTEMGSYHHLVTIR
ncbi:hypothetical protein N7490_012258 [Penicillium lividum]|nr:hypothetical protein N7490_012258 [Penicillium lividum]